MMKTTSNSITPKLNPYFIEEEPYYLSANNEIEIFTAAYQAKLPVMLKGPTGCGKTRFVAHMAHRLNPPSGNGGLP